MIRRMVCSMLVAVAATSEAQIGRQRPVGMSEPGYWVGMSVGYVDGITMTDDETGATWRFGYTSQLRATFEKSLSGGASIGIAAGFSTAPLTYQTSDFSGPCAGNCRADADISQYTAFVRGGGSGQGFHALYQLEVGITQFSKFRERATDSSLPPANASSDMTLGFGAGVSYGFSRTADMYVGQMLDFVFHEQSSTSVNQSAPRLYTLRGGFRFGF